MCSEKITDKGTPATLRVFLFNYPDDNLADTAAATSHYGDDTAPSPNIISIYEVILVWGFSLYIHKVHYLLFSGRLAANRTGAVDRF